MLNSRNHYLVFEGEQWLVIPDQVHSPLGFGKDYYAEIFRIVESNGILSGLTFYLVKEAPAALPTYGLDVVLVIVGDEHYDCLPYFRNVLAVLRCYGNWPHYLDGFPSNLLRFSALLLFLLKFGEHLRGLWRTTKWSRSQMAEMRRRTLHVPLGCFGVFEPKLVDFPKRSIDYAFLGSIDYRQHSWYSPRKLMKPPKFTARAQMVKALSAATGALARWRGRLDVSSGFTDSISKEESYALAMADCKISLCPRGSNHETYRFYESLKSACVVICEPLPPAWFHEGHPGIVVKDWCELPNLLDGLLSDREGVERLSKTCREFWDSRLAENVVAQKIETFLQGLRSENNHSDDELS